MNDVKDENVFFDLEKMEEFVKIVSQEKYAKVEQSSMDYVRLSIPGEHVQEEHNLYYSFDC
ncbi:hypothetical protein [Pseudodesulfovibrio sp.]|uniref:hypothetical protein n=1 Tax=unclassified Pseudodesulfovibrio TaxID=2661612 RepID=UPI003AFF8E47